MCSKSRNRRICSCHEFDIYAWRTRKCYYGTATSDVTRDETASMLVVCFSCTEVTNLLTLNICHGGSTGSIAIRGRFGERNAASSAARRGVRQGAGVRGFARGRSRERPETERVSGSRVFPPALSRRGGVRRSTKPVLQIARAGPLFKRDERAPFSGTVARARVRSSRQKNSLHTLVTQSQRITTAMWTR